MLEIGYALCFEQAAKTVRPEDVAELVVRFYADEVLPKLQ